MQLARYIGNDRRHAFRVEFFERGSHIERFVKTQLVDEGLEAVHKLLFLFTVAGEPLVQQASLARSSDLRVSGRIEFNLVDRGALRFAKRDLEPIDELGTHGR